MEYLNGQDCSLLLTATGKQCSSLHVAGQDLGSLLRIQVHGSCAVPLALPALHLAFPLARVVLVEARPRLNLKIASGNIEISEQLM